jgi:putative endonuclease
MIYFSGPTEPRSNTPCVVKNSLHGFVRVKNNQKPMASHIALGKKGEQIAQNYLDQQQYRILHTNWRWKQKEIDIIAERDGCLVFFEVKTRISDLYGWPEEAVHGKKRKYLQLAAEVFLERSATLPDAIRFDIIAITFTSGEAYELEHFEDAF